MSYGGLKIEGASMPPLFLKTCTQTLEVIAQGGWHRTVNGELICTNLVRQKKYRTMCSGAGPAQPGMDHLILGDVVKVHSIQRLWQSGQDEKVTLQRPAVLDSVVVLNAQRAAMDFDQVGPHVIPRFLGRPYFVGYCPVLEVRLTEILLESQQGGLESTWKVMGEEV